MDGNEKCSWFNDHIQNISTHIPKLIIKEQNENDPFFNIIKHEKSDSYINKKLRCSYNDDKKKPQIVKTFSYQIFPNKLQRTKIFSWFNECDRVYNCCIAMFNEDPATFNRNYMFQKTIIFKKLYGDSKKPAPYDMLTDEVRSFCSNLKSCATNLRNGNITHYEMTPKSTFKGRSVLVPSKSIMNTAIFKTLLKPMKGMEKIDVSKIKCDSRLVYDRATKTFFLRCPMYCNTTIQHRKHNIVALDPGEKIFMTYHSLSDCGTIGQDFKNQILIYKTKIDILNRIIARKKNRKNKRISNMKKLKTRRLKFYKKIGNMVKELHNKTALYLVKKYEKILIPSFETQNMVSSYGKRYIKNKIKELKDNPEELKKEMIKIKKHRRLSKRVKFVLNMLSHYKFRQHLKHKCIEHGCQMQVVTEEYTSKCCSNCGVLSDKYKNRVKKCPNCDYTNDRDINASKNILIKNYSGNITINTKNCMSTTKTMFTTKTKKCMSTTKTKSCINTETFMRSFKGFSKEQIIETLGCKAVPSIQALKSIVTN